jgi:hypothetical protein
MSCDLRALTNQLVLLAGMSAMGVACDADVDEGIDVDAGPVDAGPVEAGSVDAEESGGEEPRFEPLVAGNNTCLMVQAYFPKTSLNAMLPNHLTIPDDATMTAFYPGTQLRADEHPFMLSFCHGSEIHDLITETNLPEQEELMFVFPVVYTHDDGGTHLCSYVPVLYLDSEKGVEGGLFYGLRKEFHPEMMHGDDGPTSRWWSIEGIIEASFVMQANEALAELPNFFKRTFANPFVTISYPPESKTVFYEATVFPDIVTNATDVFSWNYNGTTVQSSEETQAVYSDYSFTMSAPMDGNTYFGVADD